MYKSSSTGINLLCEKTLLFSRDKRVIYKLAIFLFNLKILSECSRNKYYYIFFNAVIIHTLFIKIFKDLSKKIVTWDVFYLGDNIGDFKFSNFCKMSQDI